MFLFQCPVLLLRYCDVVSAITFAAVCAVKFVNSFARRRHLFDIAAKPIDFNSNFVISGSLVPDPISSKM